MLLTWLTSSRLLAIRRPGLTWPRPQWGVLAELGLILLWAMWIGRAYLNLDPLAWPWGGEFPLATQSHFVWTLLPRCGACMFWNGFLNGGAPALVELHGAPLHPLIIVTSLLWGVVNGAKITLVASLAMAGIAQWWLARVMGLGLVPRLWSAGLAIVGGHLAGRMELGLFPLVLSTAAASLAIAPGLELALTGRRRATVWLGVTLALALVAGQGYLQLALAFGLLPALLVFLFDDELQVRPVWKGFLLAGVLAILLAGIFLVPLAHFWPNMNKDIDAYFSTTQPLEYLPLNLVIHDESYYRIETLGKESLPYLYINYIGWVPVLLALLALRLVPRRATRLLLFFFVALVLIYLASSAITLKLLLRPFPEFLAGIRNPPLLAGLAVPLVLGLAAWGLDQLLKLEWPKLTLASSSGATLGLSTAWLVLALPLVWSFKSPYDLGRMWLRAVPPPPQISRVVQAMKQDTAQWVRPPFGEHFWLPDALGSGLKLTETFRPWHWKNRLRPPIFVEATRDPVDTSSSNFLARVDGVNLIVHPENEYAFVDTGAQQIPCRAVALGGNIDVDCRTDVPGTLVVRENQWTGWTARRDGIPVALGSGQWLNVPAPEGQHHYEFRYRPWDVLVGFFLTLVGISVAIWLWSRRDSSAPEEAEGLDQPAIP